MNRQTIFSWNASGPNSTPPIPFPFKIVGSNLQKRIYAPVGRDSSARAIGFVEDLQACIGIAYLPGGLQSVAGTNIKILGTLDHSRTWSSLPRRTRLCRSNPPRRSVLVAAYLRIS